MPLGPAGTADAALTKPNEPNTANAKSNVLISGSSMMGAAVGCYSGPAALLKRMLVRPGSGDRK